MPSPQVSRFINAQKSQTLLTELMSSQMPIFLGVGRTSLKCQPSSCKQCGHWGLEDYRLQLFFTILSTNYRLFDTLSTNFIELSKVVRSCQKWSKVAKSCKKVPDVAKKLQKAAKSCQKWSKVAKSCKKVPDDAKEVPKVAKVARLSTKLSTIWQIIDYLSKKLDYRPKVDIIDPSGHPGE